MSFFIFIVILACVVLVHELGHFLVAKWSGMRVLEFGLGFPPRLWSKTIGDTEYSINLIPFGGFVKILGEDPSEEPTEEVVTGAHFGTFNRGKQVATLAAGVLFNALTAWLLFSFTFMIGAMVPVASIGDTGYTLSNVRTIVTSVKKDSPAETAGLKAGDSIMKMCDVVRDACVDTPSDEEVPTFVASSTGAISLAIARPVGTTTIEVEPVGGIVEGRRAIGIGIQTVGEAHLGFFSALYEGANNTYRLGSAMFEGVSHLIVRAVTGNASMDEVAGPVGIAGAAGDAAQFGFAYLLGFAAMISLNLAVLNIMPFPALDGGRIVVVTIEAIVRRPLRASVMNAINSVGFGILIALMLAITWHDIAKLVMG